jgi:hypothetical protein
MDKKEQDKNSKIVRGSCICNGCDVAVEPVQEDCPWWLYMQRS